MELVASPVVVLPPCPEDIPVPPWPLVTLPCTTPPDVVDPSAPVEETDETLVTALLEETVLVVDVTVELMVVDVLLLLVACVPETVFPDEPGLTSLESELQPR